VFERALIHVDGPAGAGKTTLIEAVLTGTRQYEGVVRTVRAWRDDSAAEPRVRVDASDGMEYRFAEPNADQFFMSDIGDDIWDVALIEGDEPTGLPKLIVHVLPASAGPLLHRRRFKDGLARLKGLLIDKGMLEREVQEMFELSMRLYGRPKSTPPVAEHWAIAEEHRSLARAALVIVNVRDDSERPAADALLAEVARLRGDPEVFADLRTALPGGRTRITAVAADLTNRKDPGTLKAVARIRRAFP
jgi:hypothetical protein